MKTFLDVANRAGLKGVQRERYIKFMYQRWGRAEFQSVQNGYAGKVAESFIAGSELLDADNEGRKILALMKP